LQTLIVSFPSDFLTAQHVIDFTLLAVVTNKRVQNFAWFTILSLAALGAWQILHLRSFFKRKYLID